MVNGKNQKKITMPQVLSLVVVMMFIGTAFVMVNSDLNKSPASNSVRSFTPIPPKNYTVTINEVGLPSGYLWNVSYGGDSSAGVFTYGLRNSTSTSVVLSLQNGNYSFLAASLGYVNNYTITHYPGQVPLVVAGSNLTFYVYFKKTYNVTFEETGLPAGTDWSNSLIDESCSGVFLYNSSTNKTDVISAPNGTYYATSSSSGYIPNVNNSGNEAAYITVKGSSVTVSVTFTKAYYINFTETGLPTGDEWYIAVASQVIGNGNAETFYFPTATYCLVAVANGTWAYSLGSSVTGYLPYPSGGNVTVSGKNVSVKTDFSTSVPRGFYYLNFTESGIFPSYWGVILNGVMQTSTTSTISFIEPNGTYSYSASSFVSGYKSSSANGTITVKGSNQSIKIGFVPTHPTPRPIWAFAGAYLDFSEIEINSSGSVKSSVQFQIISVNDSEEAVELKITGLGSGESKSFYINSSWNELSSFMLNQSQLSELNNGSTGNSVTVKTNVTVSTPLGNLLTDEICASGTNSTTKMYYDRLSGILVQYSYANLTTSITVTISSTNIETTSVNAYTTTFTESNLPSGTTWYVNLSNGMKSGAITGTSYSFSVTNGTYSYTIATSNKIYESTPASGTFTVNGHTVSMSVSFSEVKYSVTFTESGLPSGTTWYVNLSNGMKSGAITGTSYSFSVTNGTYSYSLGSVSGYNSSVSSGSISVKGTGVSKSVSFSAIKKPSPSSGMSTTELYGIAGGVAGIALIGSVLAIVRKRK